MSLQGDFNTGLLGMAVVAQGAAANRINSDMNQFRDEMQSSNNAVAQSIDDLVNSYVAMNTPLMYGNKDDELIMMGRELRELAFKRDLLMYEIAERKKVGMDTQKQELKLSELDVEFKAVYQKFEHDYEVRREEIESEKVAKEEADRIKLEEEKARREKEEQKRKEQEAQERDERTGAWLAFGVIFALIVLIALCTALA